MTITNKPIGGIPIADDAVSHIFQLLRPDEIEASKTIASHIRLVNQSSCYTALLLEYSLGVRPAQLPRWKLSEGDRVAKVMDKGLDSLRTLPLTHFCQQALNNHYQIIRNAGYAVAGLHPHLYSLNKIPMGLLSTFSLVAVINDTPTIVALTAADRDASIAALCSAISLPRNAARHWAQQKVRQSKLFSQPSTKLFFGYSPYAVHDRARIAGLNELKSIASFLCYEFQQVMGTSNGY